MRRLEEAITCYQESLAICRETGDRHSEGPTLINLGTAYVILRRFEEAIGCYQQDIAICRETADGGGEGKALTKLGAAYWQMRQPDRTAACWQDAAAMRDAGDHEEAARLEDLAAIARSRRCGWRRRS
jgi:tetratricopeptide (TPR) repeat protein